MGCLGAWVLKHLVARGERPVSFDMSENRSRLNLLMASEEQAQIDFVTGDLGDHAQVERAMLEHDVTRIIHLGALQIPFCRENPVAGARVNVLGTAHIFEAARKAGVCHIAYASSAAVYGPPERYPTRIVPATAQLEPETLYGVFKQANEGTAKVYWLDHSVSSVALRPYTVYGVGRDQGLTSEPSSAMLAAARRQDYHISFGGKMQFHYASDVARQFIQAADVPSKGAAVHNLGGESVSLTEVARIIEEVAGTRVTHADTPLPFPDGFEGDTRQDPPPTPLGEGIRATIRQFEVCLDRGLFDPK